MATGDLYYYKTYPHWTTTSSSSVDFKIDYVEFAEQPERKLQPTKDAESNLAWLDRRVDELRVAL